MEEEEEGEEEGEEGRRRERSREGRRRERRGRGLTCDSTIATATSLQEPYFYGTKDMTSSGHICPSDKTVS